MQRSLTNPNQISTSARVCSKEDARINVEGSGARMMEEKQGHEKENALYCGLVSAWLLANPHTSYRDIIILYSHPTHSTSHAPEPPEHPLLLHYALQIVSIRSITWRYHCCNAAVVLNGILLPSTVKGRFRSRSVEKVRFSRIFCNRIYEMTIYGFRYLVIFLSMVCNVVYIYFCLI